MDAFMENMALVLAKKERIFMMDNQIERLREFMEQEARSCSMEYYWFMIHD